MAAFQGDALEILDAIGCELFSKLYTGVKW